MFKIDESTRCFNARCNVVESYKEPGMILVQTRTQEVDSGEVLDAHIRLTREQARQLGDELIRLADELFFKDKCKQETSHEQE